MTISVAVGCCLVLAVITYPAPSKASPRPFPYWEQVEKNDVVGGGIGGGAASDPDHDREAFESMWNRGPDEVFANLWNMDQEAAARYAEHEAKTESQSLCATDFYVIGFTSGYTHAGSDHLPTLYMTLDKHGETKHTLFPNRNGDDMMPHKGDLWHFSMDSFNFTTRCILSAKRDIRSITIYNGGIDGWNIESIITMIYDGDQYTLVTVDMNVFRWVDGDGTKEELTFELTKV